MYLYICSFALRQTSTYLEFNTNTKHFFICERKKKQLFSTHLRFYVFVFDPGQSRSRKKRILLKIHWLNFKCIMYTYIKSADHKSEIKLKMCIHWNKVDYVDVCAATMLICTLCAPMSVRVYLAIFSIFIFTWFLDIFFFFCLVFMKPWLLGNWRTFYEIRVSVVLVFFLLLSHFLLD